MISNLSILNDSLSLTQAFLRAPSVFFLFVTFERFFPYWELTRTNSQYWKTRTKITCKIMNHALLPWKDIEWIRKYK